MIIVSGLTGYVLSLDLYGMVTNITTSGRGKVISADIEKVKSVKPAKTKPVKRPAFGGLSGTTSKNLLVIKEILTHFFFFSMNALVIYALPVHGPPRNDAIEVPVNITEDELIHNNNNTIQTFPHQWTNRPMSSQVISLGWGTVGCYICFKVTNELQKVYLLYGLIRSPIYNVCAITSELLILLWHHIRYICVSGQSRRVCIPGVFTVARFAVAEFTVRGFAVMGFTVPGFAVVGFTVTGFAVVGFAIVGFAVASWGSQL